MTKEFQKELKEIVKEGVKPSTIKKLRKSKSDGDIPKAPPLPTSVPINRSKSTEPFKDEKYPYTTLVSQQEKITELEKESTAKSDTIKLLRKKIEDLEKNNPPSSLLNDQLQEKQKELENLREKLELTNSELTTLKQEKSTLLDDNLTLKHQSLKDWWQQYQQTKQLDQELKENIDEASTELLKQDKTISALRTELNQLKLTNQSLQKDLNLATKLAELRKDAPLSPNSDYLKYIVYGLALIILGLWLTNTKKYE